MNYIINIWPDKSKFSYQAGGPDLGHQGWSDGLNRARWRHPSHSEWHEGQGGCSVLDTSCYSRTLKVISLDSLRWMAEIFVLSWHAEDLCCKPNEDRWALTRAELGDTLGHPSRGLRPVDSQGGQVDVLGCWGDFNSASLGMRRKDEMGL